MPVVEYPSPAAFLEALARQLRTTPGRVPATRATEQLLTWIEQSKAEGIDPPVAFVRTVARLVYEHARLVIGPANEDIYLLAERLAALNRERPQAAQWTRSDWQNLARLVFTNRRLPLVALFSANPPTPAELLETVDLPFAARYVDDPPEPDACRIPSPPLFALLDRAQELLEATALEIVDLRAFVASLRTAAGDDNPVPRRPPSRTNSANLSQELRKSRSNSAK